MCVGVHILWNYFDYTRYSPTRRYFVCVFSIPSFFCQDIHHLFRRFANSLLQYFVVWLPRSFDSCERGAVLQYTDNEAALIGGLISTYFFQPAVSASLKDAYSRVLEHLHQNTLTSSDLQQIRKAVNFLMPMCQANRQTQRELMGINARTTALLNTSRR